MIPRDCCNYMHIIVRFRYFLGFLMDMTKAARCADMYTVCCSIEYRLW